MSLRLSATPRVATSALALALALGLSGCGGSTSDPGSTGAASSATSTTASALVIEDGWVKAADASDSMHSMGAEDSDSMDSEDSEDSMPSEDSDSMESMGSMTAMFGVLRNTSDEEVTLTGGSSPVAGRVELHETVKTDSGSMQMQQKQGGFTIPAGGSMTLEPGGDHIMLLELRSDLATGSEATVTLRTSSGEVALTVPVRAFSGAEESYEPSPSSS
ncbi:MAG: copper chaperone PCu(A)C [Ornithinibacter sp.]